MLAAFHRPLLNSFVRATTSVTAAKSINFPQSSNVGSVENKPTKVYSLSEKQPSIVERIKQEFMHGHPVNSPFTGSLLLPTSTPFLPNVIARRFVLPFRRRKMNKHKRRKRYDRDFFIYQKYHAKKKAKSEALFRQEMGVMLNELRTFNPLEHVKETIQKAKLEWRDSLAVSGRKKYPHWHELMALEELYGISDDAHIDKKAGRPSEEDEAKLKELREEYYKNFVRKETSAKN